MVPLQTVAAGLLDLAFAVLVGASVLWLVFSPWPRRAALRLARLLHVVPPAPQPPLTTQPPLEKVAADLRRIRHDLVTCPPDLPVARRRGVLQAYDDALADACAALEVPDTLHELPLGPERDAERLRVEYLLEQKGLALGPRQ
jgi:hypothetical protein